MIAANGVDRALPRRASSFASLRRVLRSPERWAKIVDLAASLGERLPAAPSNAALEEFLTKRRDAAPERFADLSLSVIKLLGRGEYVLDRPGHPSAGHFGLALRDYTHSTAPNRRYPDLITHRLLKAALAGHRSPYSDAELAALANHCTEQEDDGAQGRAARAQVGGGAPPLEPRRPALRRVRHRRVAEGHVGPHPPPRGRREARRGGAGLDVGDHVRVRLVHTDFERGFVDFARA